MSTLKYTWKRRGGYEVSSVGDKRFSAFYARMPDGRSIECHYQCDVKGYDPGGTNWRLGKGKPPLNPRTNLWKEYYALWKTWAKLHPELIEDLREKAKTKDCVLSDCFGSSEVNQAHALCDILNESCSDLNTATYTLLEANPSSLIEPTDNGGSRQVQAQLITGGSPESFDMLVYPQQHPGMVNFIRNRVETISQQFSGYVDNFTQEFFTRARNLYEQAINSEVANSARASLRRVAQFMHPNSVIPIDDLPGLQAASPVMQRYLLADPIVRPYLFDQRIDGYSDTYQNIHGRVCGEQHYDYRRVANGIAWTPQEYAAMHGRAYTPSNDEPGFIVESYFEPLLDGDRELTAVEQTDVIYAWELQRWFIKGGDDTTNPYGGEVGG